jgi:DNA-directed RNA polymerase subunit RPC12/RpoP
LKKNRGQNINALTAPSLKSKEYQQASGSAGAAKPSLQEKLTRYKMTEEKSQKIKTYHCFHCEAKVSIKEYLKKRVRCPYCGSKILYKQRNADSKVKAR